MPPEYWDNEFASIPPEARDDAADESTASSSPTAQKPLKRAAEAYCLSVLLKNPDLLAKVNRKLRELAGDDEGLLHGPLADLGTQDFSQTPYRALMAQFQHAMSQDDLEPLEYLGQSIKGELEAELEALLIDEPTAVSQKMKRNYQVDLNDILRRSQYRSRPGFSLPDELVTRALQLRLARLDSERVEMQYLQEETQTEQENDPLHSDLISTKIMLSMRAKARINTAVS